MKCTVAGVLVLPLLCTIVCGQTTNRKIKRSTAKTITPATSSATTATRPRRVGSAEGNSTTLNPPEEISTPYARPPELQSSLSRTSVDAPGSSPTSLDDPEEVSEGDVVRIETNLVTVPVSVLDRDGRFISDLRREQFNVFENGVEQKIAYFEPPEKPFTVA